MHPPNGRLKNIGRRRLYHTRTAGSFDGFEASALRRQHKVRKKRTKKLLWRLNIKQIARRKTVAISNYSLLAHSCSQRLRHRLSAISCILHGRSSLQVGWFGRDQPTPRLEAVACAFFLLSLPTIPYSREEASQGPKCYPYHPSMAI